MKMIRKFLLSIIFLYSVDYCHSQNRLTDSSATFIAFWKNNETNVYLVTHIKEKLESETTKSKSESTYEIHIKIIDSTLTSYTVEWLYKNFTVPGLPENTLSSLNMLMEGLKVLYKTDDVGSFSELLNWEEIRDFSIMNYEL